MCILYDMIGCVVCSLLWFYLSWGLLFVGILVDIIKKGVSCSWDTLSLDYAFSHSLSIYPSRETG